MRPSTVAALLLVATAAPAPGAPSSTGAGAALPSAPPGARDESAAPLSLPEAIARALQVSPRLDVARSAVEAARAQYRGARAQGLPSVELSVNGRFQGPERSLDFSRLLPQRPGVPRPSLPGGGILNPGQVLEPQLQGTVPLWTGGRVRAGKRAARAAEAAARLRVELERQRLVLDVTNAYLDTLEARRQVDLHASLRGLDLERLTVARVKQRAGTALPLEVSQAEADLAASIQSEVDARARTGQSGATLNSLIGRPVSAALVLVPLPAPEGAPELPAPRTGPLAPEQLQALGLDRPELRALREEVRRAEAGVDQARAGRRPLVQLQGSALQRIPETLLGGFVWSLGASLVQSLFDAGRSRSQVEAARADRLRARGTLRESERRAEEEVEQSRLTLDAAEQRLTADDARMAAAREALGVARTRLRAGTAAPLEVTEAETTLARAQIEGLNDRFEVARARVRLAFATGTAYPESVLGADLSPPGTRAPASGTARP